jgi:membrane AbrB-like protein
MIELSQSRRAALLGLVETFAIAAIGGGILGLANFPAGWLSGSIVFVAIAALAGRPMRVPVPFAFVIFGALGISLGAVATPETLKSVLAWPASIATLALTTICVTAATATYLRLVHGWDAVPSLFAAAPGALSQAVMMATQYHADVRGVAVVQTIRVVILTVGLPTLLGFLGLAVGLPSVAPVAVGDPLRELAILVTMSALSGIVLHRLKMRAGMMFGAMLASGFLHGAGYVHVALPPWVAAAAMCGLGAITGSRFANTGWRLLLNYVGAAVGSFIVAVAMTSLFVLALVSATPFRLADVAVSYAPGALETMMILALSMHLDPLFVGAHHLARFVLVSLMLPVAARAVARASGADKK